MPLAKRGCGIMFAVRDRAFRALVERTREPSPDFLGLDALVVAPHQDDETLGCGGTIARKADAGATVSVLFMTDGGGSHAHLMAREELTRLRRSEALSACRLLGVPEDRVHFLDFRDGELSSDFIRASESVAQVIKALRPAQVFVPHQEDGLSDHDVTHEAVARACRLSGLTPLWLEYPIWLWDQWPWTNPFAAPRERRGRKQLVRAAAHSRLGLRMNGLLNTRIEIGDVLGAKARALAEHRTQMTRYANHGDWVTLGDIDGGAWLSNFARPYEFFRMGNGPESEQGG